MLLGNRRCAFPYQDQYGSDRNRIIFFFGQGVGLFVSICHSRVCTGWFQSLIDIARKLRGMEAASFQPMCLRPHITRWFLLLVLNVLQLTVY